MSWDRKSVVKQQKIISDIKEIDKNVKRLDRIWEETQIMFKVNHFWNIGMHECKKYSNLSSIVDNDDKGTVK